MIDFLKVRWICAGISVFFVVLLIGGILYKRAVKNSAFAYALDFTGGTQAMFSFKTKVSTIELKKILTVAGWPGAVIRDFPSKPEIMVRIKEVVADSKGLAERMREAFVKALPDNPAILLQSEMVGESVGEVLKWNSIYAVIFSILAILFYIAFRFWSLAFGLGAVAALIHDTIVILGFCIFFDIEISMTLIGAMLALLGYSNNDTIVNFAQMRKNIAQMRNVSLYTIINTSLNQMLRRTILTSIATSLTILSMLFFGGEALRDFSLIFLVGIIFGTYSSVYVASPIVLWFYKGK